MAFRVHPVILSGGAGKRLWPLSRAQTPKQFLPLTSDRTLFEETLLRLRLDEPAASEHFAAPLVIANKNHAALIDEQLAAIGLAPSAVVLEPFGKNTAPAAAAAALLVAREHPEDLVLLLPADHFIAEADGFHVCLKIAEKAARNGFITTFGITATAPETGYGYIEQGAPIEGIAGAFKVARFVEKPKLPEAERYLASGRYTWNSGMFLFRADTMIGEMRRHCPAVLDGVARALEGTPTAGHILLDPVQFDRVPSIAVDVAVMEKTDCAAVVPASIGWSDVGSFAALWAAGDRDSRGNVTKGDVLLHNSIGSYVRAKSRLVTGLGLEDMIIVETADAVLVASRSEVQDIKILVDALERAGRSEPSIHRDSGAAIRWIDLRPAHPEELILEVGINAYLIVTTGRITIDGAQKPKSLKTHEQIHLSGPWKGRIAAESAQAKCLLVTLTDTER